LSYGTPPPTDGPYGQQPPYGPPAPTHGSATTALVLGILSLVVCGPLGIPAYIIGRRAEREVKMSQGQLAGEGLAKAGWIMGLIAMILMVVAVLLIILFVAIAALSSSSNA
jgi:ABC-type Fe3+ transport system permease subunit